MPAVVLPAEEQAAVPRPCLKRKRESDVFDDASPESFSETMFRTYVENALDQLERQQNTDAINSINPERLGPTQQLYLVRALTAHITRLDMNACSSLVSGILKMPWAGRDAQFSAAYGRFLTVLVSAIPRWSVEVSNRVIADFTLRDAEAQHAVLRFVVRLIPTISSAFPALLAKHFPHKSDTTAHMVAYIRNLLEVLEYCGELEKFVWGLIMERVVQLDVELFDEFDDASDDESDDELEGEDIDDFMSDSEDEAELEADEAGAGAEAEARNQDEDDEADSEDENDVPDVAMDMADLRLKLDTIVCMLFEHLDRKFSAQALESGDAIGLFNNLLDVFKTYVLQTHRTRSVQYLLFKVCHAHIDLLDAFLANMIELALSPDENIERRQKAMQYIASFVARARGLSRSQVVFVVSFLAGWLNRYVREREIEVDHGVGGMGRFKMLYAVSQALFYIFCFRHPLLRRTGDETTPSTSEWECDLDQVFQRLIVTKFNPLRYCKKTVVAMFARIAQRENAAYCFTIMEQNNRQRSPDGGPPSSSSHTTPASTPSVSSSLSSYFGAVSSMWAKSPEFVAIEGYFPFDPLLLKRARQRVAPFYVEWDDVAGDDSGSDYSGDDDNSDIESDMDSENDSDDE